jgi:exosortase
LAFFVLFALLWMASIYFKYHVAARLAILPCMAGLALLAGGWRALHWSWPSIFFLGFMIPLPGFLSDFLRQPLQRVGTLVSAGIIQTIGIPCTPRGNVIVLPSGELGVVEACSGLRMLMLFFAVCVGAAFLLRRAWWENVIIVASAIPIAVAANILRITVTAVLHEWVDTEWADYLFHDLAGLMMMPVGILLLWGELWLLSKLVVDPGEDRPLTSLLQPSGGTGRR